MSSQICMSGVMCSEEISEVQEDHWMLVCVGDGGDCCVLGGVELGCGCVVLGGCWGVRLFSVSYFARYYLVRL